MSEFNVHFLSGLTEVPVNLTEVVDCPVENRLVDNSSAQLGTEEAKQKTFDVTNAMKYFSHGIV